MGKSENTNIKKNTNINSDSKNNSNKNKNIITILIITLIMIILGLLVLKNKNTCPVFIKCRQLFKKDIINNNDIDNENNENQYKVSDYLGIEKRVENDDKFEYEYIVFTDKLPENIYKDYVESQEFFVNKNNEEGFYKKELKTYADVYKNILIIHSVERSYIEEMPIVDYFNTLYIDLNTNTILDNNDVINLFKYNLEGLITKALEDMIQNTNANNYFLEDDITILSKEDFEKKIPEYAQSLSQIENSYVRLYLNNGQLYMTYIESSMLIGLNLNYDKGMINETENSVELVII